MKNTVIEIDVAAPDGRAKRRATDRSVPGAGIQTDEDEARNVLTDLALSDFVAHDLLRRPCRTDQSGSLRPGQKHIGRRRLIG